ncbi:MAG: metalloregulator ArsR/SmtB family transcription factor [Pseudomonadota bacterium]
MTTPNFTYRPDEPLSPALSQSDLEQIEAKAAEAAHVLRLLGNDRRLLVLCHLIGAREMTVNTLAETIGISQSALSQHLAKLREDGIVAYRREGQTLHYRVADPRIEQLIMTLKTLFCPD